MWYKEENGKLVSPPANYPTPEGTICNFPADPEAMTRCGWRDWTAEELEAWQEAHPAPKPDTSAFDAACQQFRAVCGRIAAAANLPDFRGGFDEMADFAASPVYQTVQGLALALEWSAANELCKYEGAKLGLGQPQWWYQCWGDK
ncbi:MAG: hypothetical protein IJU70_06910 [Lentisphaeria bacterium]|nr:hypothetical protein [Lentisphaeria bacterium]